MDNLKIFPVQRAIILFFILANANIIFAQTQQPLTLKAAINYALNNKASAKKAHLDITNSQYQIDAVKAGMLPQINGTGSIFYYPELQQTVFPGDFVGKPGSYLLAAFGQKWGTITGVSFNQIVFDASMLKALKASDAASQYYVLSSQLTDEQLIGQIATNYYQVLLQRQELADVDSSILNITRIRKITEGQYKNGLGKKIDVDRVSVALSNLNSQRQQLINTGQQLENLLKFYMGMSTEIPISIPQPVVDDIMPDFLINTEPVDLKKRTDYQVLQKQEDLLTFQLAATKAGYYPTLSLSANYDYQGSSNVFPIGKDEVQGTYWFDYSSVSLNLKVPIFNGLSNRTKVKEQNISIQKLKSDMEDALLGLNMEYKNAVSQINNSLITLKSQAENIKLAQEIYSQAKNNYDNGIETLTDLLDAENSLTTAKNNYSSALLDYKLAEIQIIKSKGNLASLTK